MTRGSAARLLALLVLGACTAGPGAPDPSGSPEATPDSGAGPRSPVFAPGELAAPESPQAVFDRARRLFQAEDYEAVLAALPIGRLRLPPEMEADAEWMRIESKRRLLRSTVLDAFLVLDRGQVALGDPITGELTVVNLTRTPVEIPARAARQASPTTIRVEVHFREHGLDGSLVEELISWNLAVGRDLRLAPGERHAWPVLLDTLAQNPTGLTYRTYEISATLLPSAFRLGDEVLPGTIQFRPATVQVFPRNYEHLADAPRKRLLEAVEKESSVHVPLAAALVAEGERGLAAADLLAVLDRPGGEPPGPATRTACCIALRILTGEDRPADPAAWKGRPLEPILRR